MTQPPSAPPANPAVALCWSAWQRVFKAEMAKGEHDFLAVKVAHRAYRNAMPTLSGQENISDFIACVAHGMLVGAIDATVGAKLLYAAQVAVGMNRKQPGAPKRTAPQISSPQDAAA